MALRLGIDLGGTKIEIVALESEGDASRERLRARIDTPQGDYDATLAAIAGLVERADHELGERAATIGIGIPGIESPATGLVKNANSQWLIGRRLSADLERVLRRPLRLANDANCFTMSEAADGAAVGARVVFGVILGTGVGGGIVVDGRPITGANAIAGEWGHNALPWPAEDEWPGPACYCGRRGCIESFLSGPALAAQFERATGEALAPAQIAAAAANGAASAAAAMERYEHRLGRALASIINVLDPDVIVLGGGLSNIDRLYHNVPAIWARWIFSDRVATKLVRNRHGDSSGVRGAARLWP